MNFTGNMVFDNDNITYNIDDSVKDVRLQSKYFDIEYDEVESTNRDVWYVYKDRDDGKIMKLLYEDLKGKKRRDYNEIYEDPVVVTVSKSHYEKLMENYSNYIYE